MDADETRLAQAIAGLVTSAVRYAEDGSRIEVKARREADEAILTVRRWLRNNVIVVSGVSFAVGLAVGWLLRLF